MLSALILNLILAAVPAQRTGVPTDLIPLIINRAIADAPTDVVLCVEIDGHDPADKVLAILQRPGRVIVAASNCERVINVDRGSYERKTNRPAHFLSIANTLWESQSRVELQAEEYFNGKWGAHWTVRAHHVDGAWRIDLFHLDWRA